MLQQQGQGLSYLWWMRIFCLILCSIWNNFRPFFFLLAYKVKTVYSARWNTRLKYWLIHHMKLHILYIVETVYLAWWNTKQKVYKDKDQIKQFFTNTTTQSVRIVNYIYRERGNCLLSKVKHKIKIVQWKRPENKWIF